MWVLRQPEVVHLGRQETPYAPLAAEDEFRDRHCEGGGLLARQRRTLPPPSFLSPPRLLWVLTASSGSSDNLLGQCMHRDLKGENLLITANERIKMTDFGAPPSPFLPSLVPT